MRFAKFELHDCHWVAQVAIWVEVAFVLVSAVSVGLEEVHLFLCAFSMSVDSLLCHFGKDGSRQIDFHKPLPGVVLSQL